jgi:hypothetical protein
LLRQGHLEKTSEERTKILEMLQQGKITLDGAEKLPAAIDAPEKGGCYGKA